MTFIPKGLLFLGATEKQKHTHLRPRTHAQRPKNETKPRRCHPETFQGRPEVELGGLKQQMVVGEKTSDLFGYPRKRLGGPQMNIGEVLSPNDIKTNQTVHFYWGGNFETAQ